MDGNTGGTLWKSCDGEESEKEYSNSSKIHGNVIILPATIGPISIYKDVFYISIGKKPPVHFYTGRFISRTIENEGLSESSSSRLID